MIVVPAGAHRIFRTPWLHELQVRYPWFCGYAIAPFAFAAGRALGTNSLPSFILKFAPLLANDKTEEACRSGAALSAALFCGHFIRRALEVLFVNDYTGTWDRDSRQELVYYALWGLFAGAASGKTALRMHGVASSRLRLLGAALFLIGQLGNTWCHFELRRLRAERNKIGTSTYIIPSRGPFAFISTPHYSFELLTWAGYALHQGLDVSVLLIVLSVGAMGSFAAERHAKYCQLWKDGDRAGGDPSSKWKMVPGVW